MSLGFLAALAAIPILVAGILIVVFRVAARTAMPVTYVLTATIAVLVWGMPVFLLLMFLKLPTSL